VKISPPDLRAVARSAAPALALLAVALLLLEIAPARTAVAGFLRRYPHVLPGAAILLALAFRRSRALCAAAVLTAAERVLGQFGADPSFELQPARLAFHATAVLLPLDLALIGLWRERGLLSGVGLARLALLGAQAPLVAFLWLAYLPGAIAAFERPLTRSGRFAALGLAEPAVLALVLAAVVLLAVVARRAGPLEGALLGALAASSAALVVGPTTEGGTLLFGAATAIVIAGLVQGASASAYRDPLTGLPGRRAFDEALERLGRRFTVALVDVDHFKQFNDTWGHDAGDQVLRLVATRLEQIGGGGRAYRHGGEEFAVLFVGIGLEAAEPHLEAARKAIAAAGFTLRGADRPARKPAVPKRGAREQPRVTVTVSVGVAARNARHADAPAVVAAADAALYRAKGAGRNRLSR
jgi:diguanylate cyclase (GGDEF)-like protein